MALLLDTHILLWAMDAQQRLPANVRAMLANRGEAVYFSAASESLFFAIPEMGSNPISGAKN